MFSTISDRMLRYLCVAGLAAAALSVAGCQKFKRTDTQPLYQSGMWSDSIRQLRDLNVSDSEVAELIKVHQAGLSDDACIQLMHLMRQRQQMFTSGDAVAGLLHVGVTEADIMELAKLDQISPWTGESQGIRLAGYSDAVVLAVARRRSAHLPTVSATSLVELKNTGVSEDRALDLIAHGLTDEQAGQIIASHDQTELPRGFVRGATHRHH
jgi:hypothetical protein